MKKSVFFVCLMLLLIFCGVTSSFAGWMEDGIPLTYQFIFEEDGQIISDGSTGAIMIYPARRQDVFCIIAQHLNSEGVASWGDEGLELCTSVGEPHIQAIADGLGGAIAAWTESRGGKAYVFVQKVSSAGVVQWAADGVAVSTDTAHPIFPQVVTDGAGGAIVAWLDNRSGNFDIYAQKVDASGTVQWAVDGVALCTHAAIQQELQITSDSAGGAIVTWTDKRNVWSDIFAQKVNASGAVQWAVDGVAVCTADFDQSYPQITSDGSGGAIIAWPDMRSFYGDIYAQRINDSGTVQWAADGVALTTASLSQTAPLIIPDGAGGAIVSWLSSSTGEEKIFAQRVNASGAVQWTADGVALCTGAGGQRWYTITSDGSGGVIASWTDSRNGGGDIYAQRVFASGAINWPANGVPLCTEGSWQSFPNIASDGLGGAIVAWRDERGGTNGIYSQRVKASGSVHWPANGVAPCEVTGAQETFEITFDGSGGAVVAWEEYRRGSKHDIFAQKVNVSGLVQWSLEGTVLCNEVEEQHNPAIALDGSGGAIVAWDDNRSGNRDIYAQRVDASGVAQWTVGGAAICTEIENQSVPRIISDGAGGGVIIWYDNRGGNLDLYAQRVDASGSVQWAAEGVAVCTEAGAQSVSSIVSDGTGGAVVSWIDNRDGNWDIYAQRVDASGMVQWTTGGVALCVETGDQYMQQSISDGAGGAIVTWMDLRSGDWDIYAQWVNASGVVQWTTGGVGICTSTGGQYNPVCVSDEMGGAVIVWEDLRGGNSDVYAQRVDATGTVQWTAEGVALCAAAYDQANLRIISDGAGGGIVTWEDWSSGADDVYVQRVDATGTVQWTADGVALCKAAYDQDSPQITSDGAGGALVAWSDNRSGVQLYAQRIQASGDVVATMLQAYSTAWDGTSIRIDWTLSEMDEGVHFILSRASAPDWKYTELRGARIDRHGLSFAFTDETCLAGSTYKYRVDWVGEQTARKNLFETNEVVIPEIQLILVQNYPNPFNPKTTIRYSIASPGHVTLKVYNTSGQLIRTMVDEIQKPQISGFSVVWDGTDDRDQPVASGVYFYRLNTGNKSLTKKMVFLK